MAQRPRVPDLEAQRAAMKKLGFLIGKWAGEARVLRGPGDPVVLVQTEDAQYKLDGLVLLTFKTNEAKPNNSVAMRPSNVGASKIEGVGRTKTDGKPALQALGIVSYDDQSGTYHMRAFNDGRFLEKEVKLAENGHGLTWEFALGEIRTNSALQINEKGNWTELTEITVGLNPPRKFMELSVSPQK